MDTWSVIPSLTDGIVLCFSVFTYVYAHRYWKQQLDVNDVEVGNCLILGKIKEVNSRDTKISNNVLLVLLLILLSYEILPALTVYYNHITGKYCVVNSQ